MIDLPVRAPIDPLNGQRTGFSFSRFCIPKLAGYRGKAVYMDADMLVFRDIRELWEIPFQGAKVVIQQEVKFQEITTVKKGAPKVRRKQCAVMLLDCDRLDWDIDRIIDGLDERRYNYEDLMYELCILRDEEVRYGVPFEWNSLEYYDANTRLLHFTDVSTQPWTSSRNRNGYLWFDEVRMMLEDGSLKMEELEREVELAYFRPSLLRDIRYDSRIPRFARPLAAILNQLLDARLGYRPHRAVYEAKRQREQLLRARASDKAEPGRRDAIGRS